MVDDKLLVAFSAIAARQANATVATEQAVNLLLDYVATYSNDGIVSGASNMILCAHTDAGFFSFQKTTRFHNSMEPSYLLPK